MKKISINQLRTIIAETLSEDSSAVLAKRKRHSIQSVFFEDASPENVESEKFPVPLSAVNSELATKLVQTGLHDEDSDDDVIATGTWTGDAAELSPSQTSMDVNKAWWFALGMLNGTMFGSGGPGGDIDAFVSSDNYIMDGHHRWIATAMAEPGAGITGISVAFPGKKLVAVLNAATKGLLGIESGKAGSGGFSQFQNKASMKNALQSIVDGSGEFKGVAGAGDPSLPQQVIEDWTGETGEAAVDAAVDKAMVNLKSVPGASGEGVMPGAPDRIDMPVIDDKKAQRNTPAIANVRKALDAGEIDVNPPYGELPEDEEDTEEDPQTNESRSRSPDNLIMERWRRLAGIL